MELFNDGLVAADLAGYVLLVAGSPTPLPSGVLEPNAFALMVTPTFVADNGRDRRRHPVPHFCKLRGSVSAGFRTAERRSCW